MAKNIQRGEINYMLPDIKTYDKAVLIKTGVDLRIARQTNGQCSMNTTEMTLPCSRERITFSINHDWLIGHRYRKRKLGFPFHTVYKIKQITDLKYKNREIKFFKGKELFMVHLMISKT